MILFPKVDESLRWSSSISIFYLEERKGGHATRMINKDLEVLLVWPAARRPFNVTCSFYYTAPNYGRAESKSFHMFFSFTRYIGSNCTGGSQSSMAGPLFISSCPFWLPVSRLGPDSIDTTLSPIWNVKIEPGYASAYREKCGVQPAWEMRSSFFSDHAKRRKVVDVVDFLFLCWLSSMFIFSLLTHTQGRFCVFHNSRKVAHFPLDILSSSSWGIFRLRHII